MVDVDLGLMRERFGDDDELVREVAALFLEEYPLVLSQIRAAVAARDARALERAAHSLKGSVGNFGARGAYDAAFALELAGRTNDLQHVQASLARLEAVMESLRPTLTEIATVR